MRQLGTTWIAFIKGNSAEQSMPAAINRINEMVAESDMRVINVETVYRTNWLGRPIEPCGLRVWWEIEKLTAAEITQPLYDQVNT